MPRGSRRDGLWEREVVDTWSPYGVVSLQVAEATAATRKLAELKGLTARRNPWITISVNYPAFPTS